MKKLGVVTIGQSPRNDVVPTLCKHLSDEVQIIQAGALDNLDMEEINQTLSAKDGDYYLTSRLVNGQSVVISKEKVTPLMQQKINNLENSGCKNILVLCTGVFKGLKTATANLLEPDNIITPTVSTMVKGRQLGVLLPLEEQKDSLTTKWAKYDTYPLFATASPYQFNEETFKQASETLLKNGAEIILLDCMGYTEDMRTLVSTHTGIPVILSNSIMGKLISEMI